MAATLTSVWGLGVILGVAVLLIGTIVMGMAGRARRRRERRLEAQEAGKQLAEEQASVPRSRPEQPSRPVPYARPRSSSSSRSTLSLRSELPRMRSWEERDLGERIHGFDRPARDFDRPTVHGDQQPRDDDQRPRDEDQWARDDESPAAQPFAQPTEQPAAQPFAQPTEQPAARSPEQPSSPNGMTSPAEPGLVHVTVRVQNPAEEPLNNAVLTLAELDGRQVAGVEFGRDGDYDVGPLAPGNYVLVVRCPDYRPYAEVIEVAAALPRRTRVELSSDSGLTGVVRRKDGEPVSAATVTLKDDHGVVMTARTGPDGDYRVTGVRPGSYTLMVTARVCRPVELAVDVPERGLSRQDVELIGGAHVQGTVRVDQGRKVLPGTRILLLDERGEVLATTDADEQGRYRFSEVNAGEYTVCATPPSPAVSTVRIDGGLVHELDLELRQSS